ncbi:tRNA pseudouridine(13) synthase TruD [Methanococcus maripaludis]|jgi:tRNA pseudouridine13 synthase|uniref:tRNA pseudouridine(13) synthase TruD n=4 Tax=Methanococcus maripaludis TaxID=39152 RepID=A0A8T3VZG8_METMI|nr:tRNA pseudouridine(13) synthase TruD [Methanococcus maripaludis]MDK2928842.1 tRNA pseudouridine13 synthase [Methanococcus sp.]AEK18907.1 tRNA pseudouridine synthase D [Methanococcus maripaludis X1]MBG0770046.1 tRNA pseudouridine(13) synthase TruD [Methanococcus maripaludis]BAP60131.1 putative tRNA pseudouridine synthase D [Methanococcus maripaludis KA1]BAP62100.1 putative tRNA pseudouridine synthase D [Methanococcus maripaludis OS7]
MKFRQKHEDFIVNEILDYELNDNGNYSLYTLQKNGIENLKAISYLSKNFEVPTKEIGYCGLKDRHAITTQYVSIPKEYGKLSLDEDNLKLEYVGTIEKPLKIGRLYGNRFEIIARAVDKDEFLKIADNIRNLSSGAPNYYDDQRFGSVFNGKFIAKEILKGNYEEVVKILLTSYTKSEKKQLKDLKRFIAKNWGNWDECLEYIDKKQIRSKMFRNMVKSLTYENDFKKAFKYVDNRLKELFISAYQSYLWNECLKEFLKEVIPKENRIYVDYSCGTFLFYENIEEELFCKLKEMDFPTIVSDVEYSDSEKRIIKAILKKERIKISDFEKLDFGKLKYTKRPIISIPGDVNTGKFKSDELNSKKYKIDLEFSLKKGSYATIILKRVFNIL